MEEKTGLNKEEDVQEKERERFFEECWLKWKSTVEDIRIAKSQQWMTINYGFLLQFALMYLIKNYPEKWLLHFPLLIFIIVVVIFYIFQKNMREYRDLIIRLEKKFTKESRDLVDDFYQRRPSYFSFWYGSSIPIMMLFVFGAITALMIIKIWF